MFVEMNTFWNTALPKNRENYGSPALFTDNQVKTSVWAYMLFNRCACSN